MLVVLFAASAASAGVSVEPNRLYLKGSAGERMRQAVVVVSNAPKNTHIELSCGSFDIAEDGKPLSSDERQAWIGMPSSLDIGPGEAATVDVSIQIPDAARGTIWAAIFVDTVEGTVRTRIAVPIFVTVASRSVLAATPVSLSARRVDARDIIMAATIRNNGNAIVHAPFVFSVEGHGGVEIASFDSPAVLILPGRSRTVEVHLSGDFAEVETLIANVFFRFGPQALQVTSASTSISVAK